MEKKPQNMEDKTGPSTETPEHGGGNPSKEATKMEDTTGKRQRKLEETTGPSKETTEDGGHNGHNGGWRRIQCRQNNGRWRREQQRRQK